jgi:hypothetical protein
MLLLRTQFPLPGSLALFQGLHWRVFQHVGDQAVITRGGPSAALTRRAPIDELVDPVEADHNAILPSQDMSETTTRIAIFTAKLLRDANEVALYTLGRKLIEHAQTGRIPRFTDNSHLVRIMRRLGWHKDGWIGEGHARSPRYVRATAPAKAA